ADRGRRHPRRGAHPGAARAGGLRSRSRTARDPDPAAARDHGRPRARAAAAAATTGAGRPRERVAVALRSRLGTEGREMRTLYVNPLGYGENIGIDAIAHGLQHRLSQDEIEMRVVYADF